MSPVGDKGSRWSHANPKAAQIINDYERLGFDSPICDAAPDDLRDALKMVYGVHERQETALVAADALAAFVQKYLGNRPDEVEAYLRARNGSAPIACIPWWTGCMCRCHQSYGDHGCFEPHACIAFHKRNGTWDRSASLT